MLDLPHIANSVLTDLYNAKRPVIVFGWGVHLAGAECEAKEFARKVNVPVVVTWGAADLMADAVGTFGTHGVRYANFAVQNADYVLSIGSRLDTKATGSPASSFAPKAQLVMVDCDGAELDKMAQIGRPLYRSIQADAKHFLMMLNRSFVKPHDGFMPDWDGYTGWWARIEGWKRAYPAVPPVDDGERINPYVFMDRLSDLLTPDDVVVSDTGCALGWLMQAFRWKGQRFVHALNQTPMGYGLPGAIGASFSQPARRVVLVTGDGGLSVNLSELATVARHSLSIKIILFNNRGHAMCRQTQRQWLGGEYPATSYGGGLATPDFTAIAGAYGIAAWHHIQPYSHTLPAMLEWRGPAFYEVPLDQDQGIAPQARFGFPIEDQEPPLAREELAEVMKDAA